MSAELTVDLLTDVTNAFERHGLRLRDAAHRDTSLWVALVEQIKAVAEAVPAEYGGRAK